MTAKIRSAHPADRPAVIDLLHAEGLSSEGIDPSLAGFVVAEEGEGEGKGRVIGVAGLERYDRFGLLRSVAVWAEARGRGLGARLTEAVLEEATSRGLVGVYALTTTAVDYFPRLGFEVVARTEVPAPVQGSAEFSTLCPASAVALRRELRAGV